MKIITLKTLNYIMVSSKYKMSQNFEKNFTQLQNNDNINIKSLKICQNYYVKIKNL